MAMLNGIDPLASTSARLEAVRLQTANKRILYALFSLASATLLIRVIGMGMQIIVTSRFGEGAAMDAYVVAAILPTTLAAIVTTSLESSVIPIYARLRAGGERARLSALASTVINLLVITIVAALLALVLFRRQFLFLVAPALGPSEAQLTQYLALFLFPSLVLAVIEGILEILLNAEGQFGWPAYAGMLIPLSTGLIVLMASARFGIVALAIGMLVGTALQLGVVLLRMRGTKLHYRPTITFGDPALGEILRLALPVFVGACVTQASPIVDQIFASFLRPGSVSALNYALKLTSVPVGVVFAAAARAALPYLSRQAQTGNIAAFKSTLGRYILLVGAVSAGLTIFMLVFARLIVRILFQRGAFTAADTALTAATLQGFVLGLVPMAVGYLLLRAFSALGRTRMLLYVAIMTLILDAVFDYIFARLWQGPGIAAASSAVTVCTTAFMYLALQRSIGQLDLRFAIEDMARQLRFWRYRAGLRWRARGEAPAEERPATLAPALNPAVGAVPALAVAARAPERRSPWAIALPEVSGDFGWRAAQVAGVLAAGVAGAAVAFANDVKALLVVVGAPVLALLIRYRYALLLVWAITGVLNSSSLPFFYNNHPDTPLIPITLFVALFIPLGRTLARVPALLSYGVFLIWVLLSIKLGPLDTVTFLRDWLIYLCYAALVLLTVALLTTRRRLMGIIDAVLVCAAGVALFGLYGYLTHHFVDVDPSGGQTRVLSVLAAAPSLGLFFSLVTPLALFRAITLRGLQRWVVVLVILLVQVCTVLTFSRGTYISMPISIVIFAVLIPSRRWRWGTVGAIAAVTAGVLALSLTGAVPILDRFAGTDVASVNGRTYLWNALLQRFDPTQWLGYGHFAADNLLANLQIGANGIIGNGVIATSSSNLYIETLFDHGIIGLVLLLVMFASFAIALLHAMRGSSVERRLLIAAAAAVLFNMVVQSVLVSDFWDQSIAVYFWIGMALPFASYWTTTRPEGQTATSARRAPLTRPIWLLEPVAAS